ncbi:MAG: hypothetical protein AAFR15_05810, partial [Cyanobacteria bacterium J06627_15]
QSDSGGNDCSGLRRVSWMAGTTCMRGSDRQYTFVLQHSSLGRVEGEGWVAPESIVQRYWVLSDRQRRTGFETLYRIEADKYHYSSGIMAGHYLTSTMEAVVERHHP